MGVHTFQMSDFINNFWLSLSKSLLGLSIWAGNQANESLEETKDGTN